MGSRRKWAIVAASGLAVAGVVLAAVFWVDQVSAGRQLPRLIEEAERLGLYTKLPKPVADSKAEDLRRKINASQTVTQQFSARKIFTDTQDLAEQAALKGELDGYIDAAVELSKCDNYGGPSQKNDLYLEAITAAELLAFDCGYARNRSDFSLSITRMGAIRDVAALLPERDIISGLVLELIVEIYCNEMQQLVDAFGTAPHLRQLVKEANAWKPISFEVAAKYMPASQLASIDESIDQEQPEVSMWQRLAGFAQPRKVSKTIEKVKELETLIAICPRWNEPDHVLKESLARDDHFVGTIKCQEQLAISRIRAIQAVVAANLYFVEHGEWPTRSKLESLGINMTDPITSEKYEWLDVDGKKRIRGTIRQTPDQKPVSSPFFLTFKERKRMMDRGETVY
jgi:hypothetical protein